MTLCRWMATVKTHPAKAGVRVTAVADRRSGCRVAEERLLPGQRLIEKWPVLDLGVQPDIPRDKWIFTVDGLVENPIRWKWDEFISQPQVTLSSDIHCVTGWSRYDNRLDWRSYSACPGNMRPGSGGPPLPDLQFGRLHHQYTDRQVGRRRCGSSRIPGRVNTLQRNTAAPSGSLSRNGISGKVRNGSAESNSSPRTKKVSGKIVVTITTAIPGERNATNRPRPC